MERICKTCRHWNVHSVELKAGDCMHKTEGVPHRYHRARMPDGSVALLDSFGPEETNPNYTCGAHCFGDLKPSGS